MNDDKYPMHLQIKHSVTRKHTQPFNKVFFKKSVTITFSIYLKTILKMQVYLMQEATVKVFINDVNTYPGLKRILATEKYFFWN